MPAVATAAGLPSRLGKYELLLPLAAGGMARIYIGRATGIGSFERHVVLKMITPERANDLTAVNMFLDEARLAASLNHQNVAQVFEVGEDVGIHYLAMEYVHGQDLRAVLAKAGSQGTRIPLELALTIVAGAAAGLNHAHERRGPDGTPLGIVHRDVSPSNIMIGYDGAVKLLDFGIAKATARSVETQSGIIKGKFAYMAPEQCRGREVDRRSDVFSLGIILYEVSTQHRCFRADSDFDTMHRIVTGDVVRPTRLVQGYPQALEAIVMKALAVDPAQRYQSAGLLLEAIESFAVSARMSLSTMGLGRFMRDMFGEVQEPWLNTAATKVLQPIAAKESTISSTDGKGSQSAPALARHQPPVGDTSGIPDEEAAFPDSAKAEAAKTILDLPRNPHEREPAPNLDETPGPQEWNAKSYPAPLPNVASSETLPPDAQLRAAYVTGIDPGSAAPHAPLTLPPEVRPLSTAAALSAANAPQTLVDLPPMSQMAAGTHPPPTTATNPGAHAIEMPLPAPGSQPFATAGSGTGSALPSALGIPSTKHGYASAAISQSGVGDVSYPRYEVPPEMITPDVQLTPNRRPLLIGLGIAVVGIVIIAALMLRGGDEQSSANREADDETQSETTSPTPEQQVAPPSDDGVLDDNMVSVVIHSEPKGADVLIAGVKVGVTPFDHKLKRGTKIAQLTVRKEGYVPWNGKIDLGGEYENRNIKLVKVGDAPEGSAATEGDDKHDKGDDKGGDKASDQSTTKSGEAGAGTTGDATPSTGAAKTATSSTKTGTADKPSSTDKTIEKATASSKTATDKATTATKPATKTSTKSTSTGTGTVEKKKEPAKEKCQPPGPNLDPYGPPVCPS